MERAMERAGAGAKERKKPCANLLRLLLVALGGYEPALVKLIVYKVHDNRHMLWFSRETKAITRSMIDKCLLSIIDIPSRVTHIEWGTFEGCGGLTSITIPEGVTHIEWGAFSGCSGLTSVTIPEGVTHIGGHAFNGWSSWP